MIEEYQVSLTAIDRTILRIVQEDANTKVERIAEEAGTSTATVQRRLRHMRDAGIIENNVAQVNPKLVGKEMTFVILVELERERIDILDKFKRKMQAEPQVQQCYYII